MDERQDPLRSLQMLWAAVLACVVMVAVIVVVVAQASPELPAALPALLVAALGVAAFVGVEAVDRTFAGAPPADDQAALVDYRTRLILQVAILEAPVLLAVALAFVLGPGWVVLVGAATTVIALLRVRPSLTRLRRFDHAWQSAGRDVSLERAVHQAGLDS